METVEYVLEKIKEARKEKGYNHENMAQELGISQSAYTNLENNESKLSIERLIKLSEILDKPTYYFFKATPNNIYNQNLAENSVGYQQHRVDKLYQENKGTYDRLAKSYEATIHNLKEEVAFLRQLVANKK